LATALSNSIAKSAVSLIEDPHGRLPMALMAINIFQEQLRSLRQNSDEVFRRCCSDAATLRSKLQRGEIADHAPRWRSFWGGKGHNDAEKRLLEYCRWRLRTIVYQQLSSLLQSVSGSIAELNEQILQLRPRLEQLSRSFASTVSGFEAGIPGAAFTGAGGRGETSGPGSQLASPEFLLAFDQRIQQDVLSAQGGLLSLVAAGGEQWKNLRTQLQLYARESVLLSMRDMDAAKLFLERRPREEQLVKELQAALEKAAPRIPSTRSVKRVLAVVPRSASGAEVAEAISQHAPNVALTVSDADSDLVFCQEAELLSLTKVAAALIEHRPDYAATARRVLTRLDVPWSSLSLGAERGASPEVHVAEPVGQG
jgi:hypothetical protein